MTARQPKPTGAKHSPPLQILVYTPQSGGTKGAPQTSEVFDMSGSSSKDGTGGDRILEFTNGNGETLRIPEYTTHTIKHSSSTLRKAEGQYRQPITTTPAAPIYPHHHHRQFPDRFLHLYLSHQEPSHPLPPPPPLPYPLIPPTPQQSPEFAMTTMAIPPISEEEWTMLISPESPLEETLGLNLGPPAVTEELLEACLPVDSTDEGRQWWHELLCAGDEQEFWTNFLASDERAPGGEVGWSENGVGQEMQGGGCGGLEGGPGGWEY